jgi:hypothetical protein
VVKTPIPAPTLTITAIELSQKCPVVLARQQRAKRSNRKPKAECHASCAELLFAALFKSPARKRKKSGAVVYSASTLSLAYSQLHPTRIYPKTKTPTASVERLALNGGDLKALANKVDLLWSMGLWRQP